jgi:hypothetical protein
VTLNTSSPSAKGTPKTDDALEGSGIQRESIDPLYVNTYREMQQMRNGEAPLMTDWHYAVWNIWGRLKHLVGLHTMIPLEEWDLDNGSMKIIGSACWHCPKEYR